MPHGRHDSWNDAAFSSKDGQEWRSRVFGSKSVAHGKLDSVEDSDVCILVPCPIWFSGCIGSCCWSIRQSVALVDFVAYRLQLLGEASRQYRFRRQRFTSDNRAKIGWHSDDGDHVGRGHDDLSSRGSGSPVSLCSKAGRQFRVESHTSQHATPSKSIHKCAANLNDDGAIVCYKYIRHRQR